MPVFSPVDRVMRAMIGLAVLSMLVFIDGPARYVGCLGIVPLLAGIMGRCPIPGMCTGGVCALPSDTRQPPQQP